MTPRQAAGSAAATGEPKDRPGRVEGHDHGNDRHDDVAQQTEGQIGRGIDAHGHDHEGRQGRADRPPAHLLTALLLQAHRNKCASPRGRVRGPLSPNVRLAPDPSGYGAPASGASRRAPTESQAAASRSPRPGRSPAVSPWRRVTAQMVGPSKSLSTRSQATPSTPEMHDHRKRTTRAPDPGGPSLSGW